ncbi:uncharacterized protein LOC111347435 [Stylophora pistillata]|uniref:uncharacterized protein LOC111347435 n=1 Tax=Stylophora pistillata TaxID=50429 RepID=UPI000C05049F|nr:uncharacterized protein LOC111347435 [Stylophora pistillata]
MIRHLKFIFIWISLIPQLTDGGSVTWYEPAPVRTTSNPADVLPVFIVPVYEGKPATLNWSYSLTLGLDLGGIRFKNVRLVKINSDGSAGPVGDNFPRWLSVSSTIGTVSLSISAVTVADDKANGEFSCEVVDSNLDTWKRAIQVQVLVLLTSRETHVNFKILLSAYVIFSVRVSQRKKLR